MVFSQQGVGEDSGVLHFKLSRPGVLTVTSNCAISVNESPPDIIVAAWAQNTINGKQCASDRSDIRRRSDVDNGGLAQRSSASCAKFLDSGVHSVRARCLYGIGNQFYSVPGNGSWTIEAAEL